VDDSDDALERETSVWRALLAAAACSAWSRALCTKLDAG
jgi:hypothetical protein